MKKDRTDGILPRSVMVAFVCGVCVCASLVRFCWRIQCDCCVFGELRDDLCVCVCVWLNRKNKKKIKKKYSSTRMHETHDVGNKSMNRYSDWKRDDANMPTIGSNETKCNYWLLHWHWHDVCDSPSLELNWNENKVNCVYIIIIIIGGEWTWWLCVCVCVHGTEMNHM